MSESVNRRVVGEDREVLLVIPEWIDADLIWQKYLDVPAQCLANAKRDQANSVLVTMFGEIKPA